MVAKLSELIARPQRCERKPLKTDEARGGSEQSKEPTLTFTEYQGGKAEKTVLENQKKARENRNDSVISRNLCSKMVMDRLKQLLNIKRTRVSNYRSYRR